MSDARPTKDAQTVVPGATAGPGAPDSPTPVSVDLPGAERRTVAREKIARLLAAFEHDGGTWYRRDGWEQELFRRRADAVLALALEAGDE